MGDSIELIFQDSNVQLFKDIYTQDNKKRNVSSIAIIGPSD